MNFVDRLLNEILAESPAQPAVAPPKTKPMAPPAPSKPRPGTRPTIPTRRPGVAPRPKARRDDDDEMDARTYPKASDVSHFTPQTGSPLGQGFGYSAEDKKRGPAPSKPKRRDLHAKRYPNAMQPRRVGNKVYPSIYGDKMVEEEGGAISVPPPPASEDGPETGTQPAPLSSICGQIRPGDRVTILTPQGQRTTGRAVMRNQQHGCWVLNMGGPHGTPGIADDENIVYVKRGGKTIYGKI